jgi:hypothetical protein
MARSPEDEMADVVIGMATTRAMVRTLHLLLQKGIIAKAEYEAMRHLYLRDIEAQQQIDGLPASARATIERHREFVESFWDLREDQGAEPGPRRQRE